MNPKRLSESSATVALRATDSPTAHDLISATVNETVRRTGLSRTVIFRLLAAGQLRAVKAGTRTLVQWNSVEVYLANLPAAKFGSPR